jgi:hypothetical protein
MRSSASAACIYIYVPNVFLVCSRHEELGFGCLRYANESKETKKET